MNDEAEDFTTLYSTTHFVMMYVPEHLHEREVVEIHADTNDTEQTFIHIELEEEEICHRQHLTTRKIPAK